MEDILKEINNTLKHIVNILEGINEYIDVEKSAYRHNFSRNEAPPTFQEVLIASRQFLQES